MRKGDAKQKGYQFVFIFPSFFRGRKTTYNIVLLSGHIYYVWIKTPKCIAQIYSYSHLGVADVNNPAF